MFGLDPFNRPVAIAEMLLLLALAAFVGWLLGRLARAGRVSAIRSALADKKAELEKCQREKGSGRSGVDVAAAESSPQSFVFTADVPEAESAIEVPQFFVSADPLLPAYSHDDTPAPLLVEPLSAPDESLVFPDEPLAPVDETLPSISSTLEFPLIEEAVFAKQAPIDVTSPVTTPIDDRETVVLNRIAARASELNFNRIGRALATEADDLKDIVGVGPFLERKLHSLGIYTFRQIANFTKEDVHKVNEIVEFFPGRIERDNWVGQSKTFYERKYGNKN